MELPDENVDLTKKKSHESPPQHSLNPSWSQDETDGVPEPVEIQNMQVPLAMESDDPQTQSLQPSTTAPLTINLAPNEVQSNEGDKQTAQFVRFVNNNVSPIGTPTQLMESSLTQSSYSNQDPSSVSELTEIRSKTQNASLGTNVARGKQKDHGKWSKTQRSITSVGCRLRAIQNSCKSNKLIIALRNRRNSNGKMAALPYLFT
ncbi:unnamed protein product [Echinostoma caproni]|uniref:Ovule protein n=1 Tax=Echinostoma caproni TaxID=27848 RepID=A0A183A411_9TREM|nr:unnamed protein product [Echinostoma caproni]